MMPRYGASTSGKPKLHEMIRLKDIEIPVGRRPYPASVKSSFIVNNQIKVQVYFLDNPAPVRTLGAVRPSRHQEGLCGQRRAIHLLLPRRARSPEEDWAGSPTSFTATTGRRDWSRRT